MKDNSFYRSRKFAYTLGTFLAALIVWLLPMAIDMEPAQVDMLNTMLPGIFVAGVALVLGHSATDITAIWKEGLNAKELKVAVTDIVTEILEQLHKPEA